MIYYTLNNMEYIYFDGDVYWTFDATHRFYQQYLAWLAEGNTPEEWNSEVSE